MKFWTIQRRLTYEEYQKEEAKVKKVMGENVALASPGWWVDCFGSADFNEVLRYLNDHHGEFNQWRLTGVEVKGGT